MPEWRTQPQVDADEALSNAIAAVVSAYSEEALEGRVVGEYMVVSEMPGLAEELAGSTRYEMLLSNGTMPRHHLLGLIEWAHDQAREPVEED